MSIKKAERINDLNTQYCEWLKEQRRKGIYLMNTSKSVLLFCLEKELVK